MEIKLKDGKSLTLPSDKEKRAPFVAEIIKNRGHVPGKDQRIEWREFFDAFTNRDTVTTGDIRALLQSSIEIAIREPVEPIMAITPLFTKIVAKGLDVKVVAGAMGAVYASDYPERGTAPEVSVQQGGGMQVCFIGKSGLQVSWTDEVLRYSTWDLISLMLKQMRLALVRHKEAKAVDFLRNLGTELFNNRTPATSAYGVLTGRGIDGSANGSLTHDDILKALAHGMTQGYAYDTMLVNPQFYFMGLRDPVLRHMYLAHGGGSMFRGWQGNPGPLDPWSNGSMGSMGPSHGSTFTPYDSPSGDTPSGMAGKEFGMTSTPPLQVPYFPWNFRIIASPSIPFDEVTNTGDIIFTSSGNVGLYLEDEGTSQIEWRDETTETQIIKLKERYGFAVANEGQGIGVMKNVKLERNYWDGTIDFHSMDIDAEIAADTDLSSVL